MKTVKNQFTLVAIMLISILSVNAQTPTFYQNWTALPDSPSHLEVSWATCKCDSASNDEIKLFVFNEAPNPQVANFTITISEEGKADVTYTVSELNLTTGQMIQPNCGDETPAVLTLSVPEGFDATKLTISIIYN